MEPITRNVSKAPVVTATVLLELGRHRRFQKGVRAPNPKGQW